MIIDELITYHTQTAYVFLGLFSLMVGSLLNVIIYRLPVMLQTEWKNDCRRLLDLPTESAPRINLFFPGSFCPLCRQKIPFWHNIPLISYCLLRGRCSHCRQPMSWRYPLVEASCMGLSLLAGYVFGFNLHLLFALVFISLVLCLFVIDLEHQLLPDGLNLGLLWVGLLANTQHLFTSLPDAVLSAAGAYLTLWLLITLFYLLTGKVGMGHGDFKLFAALGAWFGWTALPLILLSASLTGAIIGLFYLKIAGKTKETPIPFGPFLCFSGLVILLYGPTILQWYVTP